MLPPPLSPIPFAPIADRPPRADRLSHRKRLRSTRGLTLIEVTFASVLLTMVTLGVLQGMLQSRRQTEGSVRQASVASLVQGYLEQLKSIKYGDLPTSPSATPGTGTTTDWAPYMITLIDSAQNPTNIYLAAGTAPTTLPVISTLPTNISMRTEQVDIDNINAASDNSVLNMWVWVNDMTDATNRPNVVNCKSLVIVYQYTVRDGGRTRYYSDLVRTIRSIVPTD